MPRRPTKKWWGRCVAGVTESGGAAEPARVCGAVWSRKPMSERKAIAREEGADYKPLFKVEYYQRAVWHTAASAMTDPDDAVKFARSEANRRNLPTRVVHMGGTFAHVFPSRQHHPLVIAQAQP